MATGPCSVELRVRGPTLEPALLERFSGPNTKLGAVHPRPIGAAHPNLLRQVFDTICTASQDPGVNRR